ncbi:unnamed protein product [Zymoseptoria tritici ST99CH_1E4]|uniref:BTB domain-containing protein n=1 Tax=Zymoseptoria tritici ST99CH_1E4 TaxID=1276532 RepID=A0A2H1H3M7_ZYMTR|nr:unnamed protein product [Zymoseptoria tritici ST99CH_1E4]
MEDPDELISNLQSSSQRFIEISFGTKTTKPIRVPQQTLECLSPYFKTALKKNTFKEGVNGTISLPEDEYDVWKVLLYWFFNHKLPDSMHARTSIYSQKPRYLEMAPLAPHLRLATRCWIAGDKYEIPQFQDAVMLCILRYMDAMQWSGKLLEVDVLLLVLDNTVQGSPLQELFVDWVAVRMHTGAGVDTYEGVLESSKDSKPLYERLDGTGFYPAMLVKRPMLDMDEALTWRANRSKHDDRQWTSFFLARTEIYDCRCEYCD